MKQAKIKVMAVFGTRPEAIKMAPLVKEMSQNAQIEPIVCVSAQHRQMLDQVLSIFNITPDHDLNIMRPGQTLTDITTNAMLGIEGCIVKRKPDIVLVHGDTTTTLAGSLAAFHNKVMVGHVEAGLRTFDKYSPYPEEINRRITSQIADLHFAPTKTNKENLLRENITKGIFITGNTVIDALKTTVHKNYKFKAAQLKEIDLTKPTILLTAHRRENLGEPLENIMRGILEIVQKNEGVQVVYPVHLNPAVRETVFSVLGGVPNVFLIDPVDVEDLHNLMNRVTFVMTDSGGLQEEAPALGKPVLVLREETERPEAVEHGTVKIAGTSREKIVHLAEALLHDEDLYRAMSAAINPYGDGAASRRIVQAILFSFGKKSKAPDDFCV